LLSIYSLSAQNDTAAVRVINTIIQKQEDAWNKHKLIEMGTAYFADDATLINFLGILPRRVSSELNDSLI